MQEAIIPAHLFCNSLYAYSRRKTREVTIGEIPMGANHPIRVQSMTTTDTMDTLKTVEQSIRMIEAGCEYVRITAPSLNEAQNLQNIKDELKRRGYSTPLIADIHFTPNAAEIAANGVMQVAGDLLAQTPQLMTPMLANSPSRSIRPTIVMKRN